MNSNTNMVQFGFITGCGSGTLLMSKGTNLLGLSFVLSGLTSSNPFASIQPIALIGHTNNFKYIGIYRDGDMTYRLKIVFPNQGVDGGDINILFPYEWLYTNYGVE